MSKIKKKCPKKGKVIGLGGLGEEGGSGKGDVEKEITLIEKEIKGIGGSEKSGEGLSTKKCHCTGKCQADGKCEICGRVSKCAGALCQGSGLEYDKSGTLREGFEGYSDTDGGAGQGEGELSTKSSYYHCECKEDNKCTICGHDHISGREFLQDLRPREEDNQGGLVGIGLEGKCRKGAEAENGLLYCLDWPKLRALLVFTAGSFLTMRMALLAVELS